MREFVSIHTLDEHPGIATLLLSRPPTNGLTRQKCREIITAAAELGYRDDIAAVILFGGHEIFCAGDDVTVLQTLNAEETAVAAEVGREAVDALGAIPKPTVAAITGYALGSGLTLALAADWRVAGDNIKVGATEILSGFPPGETGRLVRAIGESKAKDLVFSGRFVDAREALGGVCLNIGCIPSKALLHAARVIAETREMGEHGLRFAAPEVDLDALRSWKDGVVKRLTGGVALLARQRKVTTVRGTGRFVSPNQLEVATADGSAQLVGFQQAIIACGSEPVTLPFIPSDDPRVIDSEGALELSDVPGRLLVLGGGIIGLEMATVYSELGSRITVVELLDQLIPGADKDLVAPLQKTVAKRYDNIFLKTKVTGVEAAPEGLRVSMEGADAPATDTFDKILVSVGSKPSGKLIGAEAAGVVVDDRGFIPVDKQLRTNVGHIFAIGDVVGQPMLAHKAVHEGHVAAEAAAGRPSYFDARVIPSVAYTDPEVAWVGATETEAKAAGVKYGKGNFPWAASGRALSLGRGEGMTKLLFDENNERLIGAGMVGPNAGELVAEAALAIEMGADAADIGLTVHPHPTLSETVGMSAEAFEGIITDLYVPKKRKR